MCGSRVWKVHNQCVRLTKFIWRSISNPKCHMTFSETKISVNWHKHSILKCHLNFGLHNILEKLLIEHKYPSVLYVSPNVDNSPIYSIHFKLTKRDLHKSLKGLQVQPFVQIAFNCILFGNFSLTNSYTRWHSIKTLKNNGLVGLVLSLHHLSYHRLNGRAFPVTKEITRTRLNLSM